MRPDTRQAGFCGPSIQKKLLIKRMDPNWTSHLRFNNIIQYSFNHIQCMSFMIHPSIEEETQRCKHLFHSKTTIFGYLQVDPINLQIWQNNLLWAFKSMKTKWPAIFLASTPLQAQRLPQPQVISSDLKCLLQQLLNQLPIFKRKCPKDRKCNHSVISLNCFIYITISYPPTRLTPSSLHIAFLCDENIEERSGPAMDSPPRIVCRSCWTVPPTPRGTGRLTKKW